jgi:hypothetical protein
MILIYKGRVWGQVRDEYQCSIPAPSPYFEIGKNPNSNLVNLGFSPSTSEQGGRIPASKGFIAMPS